MNQSGQLVEKLSYKYMRNIANTLFVLSQDSLKQKLLALELTKKIQKGDFLEKEIEDVQKRIKSILKTQQYFHAERQIIIHYLLRNDIANFKEYVEIKGNAYGLVKFKKYNMYCIVNKKLIKKFDAKKIGEEFIQMPILPDEELEQIIPLKDAKRVFKLYYNEVLRKTKKSKPRKIQASKGNLNANKDKVLGTTKSASGSVVVIKRRKV